MENERIGKYANFNPTDFYSIIRYTKFYKMCLKPGCLTCGNMEFRNLICDVVGKEKLIELLVNAPEEYMKLISNVEFYDIFRIILVDFPELEELDCPLVNRYREYCDKRLAAKTVRQEKAAALEKEQQEAAAIRREQHQKEAEEHRKRSEEKRRQYYDNLEKGE